VIALSEIVDVPLLVVHVSSAQAIEQIRQAQARGLKIYAETCPQYLFLTADDMDKPGFEGAMCMCSPPPRNKANQEYVWRGLQTGVFDVFSSDHAPYRFDDPKGKKMHGENPPFKKVANGVPGVETRLPLLFSEGVLGGRIDINHFVALCCTNPAKMYGLYPRKGTIAIGGDADIAIWDPEKKVTISIDMLHDNMDYTPYEGRELTGWPVTVLSRGRVVVEAGELEAERGSGRFLPCDPPEPARPRGRPAAELDPARNFGAELL
jgi:dihydropyrimidinase